MIADRLPKRSKSFEGLNDLERRLADDAMAKCLSNQPAVITQEERHRS